MTELSNDQLERGVAALIPFVQSWNLPLNPEHLYEIAYAVLLHGDSSSSFEDINAAVQAQIREADERFRDVDEGYRT